jgi:hypothetical protein
MHSLYTSGPTGNMRAYNEKTVFEKSQVGSKHYDIAPNVVDKVI